jgi:hypothetical protein
MSFPYQTSELDRTSLLRTYLIKTLCIMQRTKIQGATALICVL